MLIPISSRRRLLTPVLFGLAGFLVACREPVGIVEASPAPTEVAVAATGGMRSAVALYSVDAITIETRAWDSWNWVVFDGSYSTWTRVPPRGLAAVDSFEALPRTTPGYTNTPVALPNLTCSTFTPGVAGTPPDYYDGRLPEYRGCVTNPGDATAAQHANLAVRYRVRVTATRDTDLAVRFGVDFAGGVLLVDGQVVKQLWNDPFWNGYFVIDNGDVAPDGVTYVPLIETDTSTVLTSSFFMKRNTTHIIEVVGFENGGDFGAAAQLNDGGGWVDVVATVPAYKVPLSVSIGAGGGKVVSAPAGINCGLVCSASFAWATRPSLTAVPDQYFASSGWTGACSGVAECTPLVETPRSVTAAFARVQWPLQVTRAGTGQGTVTSADGVINCGAVCLAGFPVNGTVRLTATGAANSDFIGWSGACFGSGACILTMNQVRNVTATFRLKSTTDVDPPVLSCKAAPNVLWPVNHKLVKIKVDVSVSDAGSGVGGFKLISVASNEPLNATGDGNTSADWAGWTVNTSDVEGEFRAERSGSLRDRVYTLTYEAWDVQFNKAVSSCTVTVPHDQGNADGDDKNAKNDKSDKKP